MLHWLDGLSTTWPDIMRILRCHPHKKAGIWWSHAPRHSPHPWIPNRTRKIRSLGERPTQAKNTSPRAFQQMQGQSELQFCEKHVSKMFHQKNLPTCQLTLPAFGAPTLNSWGHLEIGIGPSFLRWWLPHSRNEERKNGWLVCILYSYSLVFFWYNKTCAIGLCNPCDCTVLQRTRWICSWFQVGNTKEPHWKVYTMGFDIIKNVVAKSRIFLTHSLDVFLELIFQRKGKSFCCNQQKSTEESWKWTSNLWLLLG